MAHSASSAAATGKAPLRILALIVLALLGLGLSVYLSYHYYELRAGASGFKSTCNLSQTLNCDAVAASSYAEVFPGIPLSSFAAGWYLTLIILYLLAYLGDWRREAIRGAFLMTGLATLASVAYFIIMASVLHVYCLFCLFLDAINPVSLVLVLSLRPEGTAGAPVDGARWKSMAGILVGCLFVSIIALKGMDQLNGQGEALNEMVTQVLSTPPVAVDANEAFPSFGPKNAPITVVEFSDFQCPYCRMGAMNLNAVLERYPGKIRVVFRNFPLDPSCNRLAPNGMHHFACEAARVGICANKQGKFEPYYEEMFENQKDIGSGKPAEIARSVGVNEQQLSACVSDPATTQAISADIEEGSRLGVQSTPTFFVNGRRMDGAYPPPVWARIIDALLKGTPSGG